MLDVQLQGAVTNMGTGDGTRYPGFVVQLEFEKLARCMGHGFGTPLQAHPKYIGSQVLHRRYLAVQGPWGHADLVSSGDGERVIPSSLQRSLTRVLTDSSMTMGIPHSRSVSPGHLSVASSPILEPRPATGEAKSR